MKLSFLMIGMSQLIFLLCLKLMSNRGPLEST